MTPTLLGRWQTRLLLLATVGVLITIPFALGFNDTKLYWILGYVAFFGVFFWDVLYDYLQKRRWDRDWPGVYQLAAGVWEAIFLGILFSLFGRVLPGLDSFNLGINLGIFILHYSCVWLGIYIVSQSLMRIVFPRWRFRGGQWL
ncbi:hypothetical protein [Pseudanabaena sp. PCC 6802]|uniref:hypothetical protein n=1 Tax=Pseudanabaena sp. PCC 6802 TaxID=118173 RepID=UPI0003463B63|nr:hypothetical protein [Pseudanabaena sp. PCC 6802]